MTLLAGKVSAKGRNIKGQTVIIGTFMVFLIFLTVSVAAPTPSMAARIKDLAYINGVRSNQLVGYGLVVGLKGTGDKSNTIFTNQSLANMLEKMGVRVDPTKTKVNNIAAVIVTADLPAFGKVGNRIDASVSSIGDAKSLEGGVLLLTPLRGADGEVYAMAQGSMIVGGYLASGTGATIQKNHPTVGRIPNGVTIEREISYDDFSSDLVVISLKNPDFTNARRVAEKINETFHDAARPKDGGTIDLKVPNDLKSNPVKFISMIENLEIKPSSLARIVVDEKTGTVVIGENLVVSTVAVSHGNISVQVKEEEKVSQPLPFGRGQTVVTPDTKVRVEEEKGRWVVMKEGITIKELVSALNASGVSTRDVITIIQTIKAAGALHAELDVI
ncbi:MAG: Flagellar P-ring protein precursor [Syntrophorhabdus sp. PtaU1.Bin002]|nr:MAG: Flagellar P-ring protein precursor [Syntrophorhabdus sp. PtaB.Bin006]OPY73573.1 MAG: Flagellar P-ring protein precursor [Syntrophorhabdus sp. PtaU1.Bin002]